MASLLWTQRLTIIVSGIPGAVQFIGSFSRPPRKLALDFDATDAAVHGHQPGGFFEVVLDFRTAC